MDSLLIRTYVWAALIAGILGMPEIRIAEGPNYFVALGSTINLTCLVAESISPLGQLSWLHDGKGVYQGGIRVTTEYGPNTVSVLQIQNVTAADDGNYTCQSEHGHSADVLLHVLDGSISAPMDSLNDTRDSDCVYEGTFYPLGQFFYPDEENNPCLVCECKRENWNGVDNQRCFQEECPIDYDGRRALEAGCVPVYQEKKCCPVRYYCPQSDEDPSHGISDAVNENSTVNSNQCRFEGKTYDVGMEVSLNKSCIKCSCSVPPAMKCFRQSCPPNERIKEDESHESSTENIYENCPTPMCVDRSCVIRVPPGHQCPICICEKCPTPMCVDKSCVIGVPPGHQCPICICENCPTPMCADKSCVIGVPPGHQCPTCICEVSKEEDLEVSYEKNDLEPVFEGPEQPYIEIYNGTQPLDNEIPVSVMAKNFSEREFLSPELGENNPHKNELEGGERNKNSKTEIFLLNEDESSLNETEFEPSSMQSNKLPEEYFNHTTEIRELRQKRSGNLETAGIHSTNSQQQWNVYQQDQFIDDSEDSGENSERELEGNDDEFSEVKILSTKTAQKSHDELVELDDNELENVIWTTEVAGCPAPMCANSSCRIGIPQGHTCPTCVCRKKRRQP